MRVDNVFNFSYLNRFHEFVSHYSFWLSEIFLPSKSMLFISMRLIALSQLKNNSCSRMHSLTLLFYRRIYAWSIFFVLFNEFKISSLGFDCFTFHFFIHDLNFL
jgi:hypothetical protein